MDFALTQQAREILSPYVPVSRMVHSPGLSGATGAEVYLKLENEGPTGSFKTRGAIYTLWRRMQSGPLPGVVTSSTGNHGAATAYAARRLDVPAAIFLPEGPNPVKRALIAREGAHIVEAGKFLEESRQHAAQHAREKGWHLVVDGEDEHLTAGASTIGCEIVEQAPSVDIILVPVGDSSLIRGTAFAAKHGKSKVQVVGVVADRAPAYYRSWKERRAVSTESSDTIADGLAVRATVEANVRQLLELVDDMRMVTDDEMLRAMYHLLVEEHVVAEPAGAAATAALVKSGRQFAGKKVVLLVTGANVPPELLRRALNLASS